MDQHKSNQHDLDDVPESCWDCKTLLNREQKVYGIWYGKTTITYVCPECDSNRQDSLLSRILPPLPEGQQTPSLSPTTAVHSSPHKNRGTDHGNLSSNNTADIVPELHVSSEQLNLESIVCIKNQGSGRSETSGLAHRLRSDSVSSGRREALQKRNLLTQSRLALSLSRTGTGKSTQSCSVTASTRVDRLLQACQYRRTFPAIVLRNI